MNLSFENQVALVTGAASGLGLATARAFARSGAAVVPADFYEKAVPAAADALAAEGHKTLAVHCDASDNAQVEAMIKRTVETFGQLDCAYNNEGLKTVPIERIGRADEIADVVLWLCSTTSTYVIGQGIAVDGGYTIQ